MLIVSDYSGQQPQARYESLSFLFADPTSFNDWILQRESLRRIYLPDGRRISYKTLNDRKRKRALMPFLAAANSITGLIVTILVSKKIESLFEPTGKLDTSQPGYEKYAHWDRNVLEKLLRIVNFAALFIAGLSKPHQNLFWITDEDDIVANAGRLREAVDLFAHISSAYIKHQMGHFRWGTTQLDKGSKRVEDLASIPDVVAGSLSQVLTTYYQGGTMPKVTGLMVPPPSNLSYKDAEIMNWFADQTQPLKRLVYVIEQIEGTTKLNVKNLWFHGLADYQGAG